MKISLAIILALVACGGAPKGGGDMHPEHHDKLTPELSKFNDAIAPTWHAAKGEQRAKDACAAADQLDANASEVAKAAAPAGADGTKWSAGTSELTDSVAALKASCAGAVATSEPALDRVHAALHNLIGLSGGHHEADGSHTHSRH